MNIISQKDLDNFKTLLYINYPYKNKVSKYNYSQQLGLSIIEYLVNNKQFTRCCETLDTIEISKDKLTCNLRLNTISEWTILYNSVKINHNLTNNSFILFLFDNKILIN